MSHVELSGASQPTQPAEEAASSPQPTTAPTVSIDVHPDVGHQDASISPSPLAPSVPHRPAVALLHHDPSDGAASSPRSSPLSEYVAGKGASPLQINTNSGDDELKDWEFQDDDEWKGKRASVFFSFLERMEIMASIPFLGYLSGTSIQESAPWLAKRLRLVRDAQEFLEARNMKRLSYLELWKRRDNDSVDMEIAIELKIWNSLWGVGSSVVMLMWSLLQLAGTTVPVVFDHCSIGILLSARMPTSSLDAFVSSDSLPASDFTSAFISSGNSTTGYETYKYEFGVCSIPASLDATLGHDEPMYFVAIMLALVSSLLFVLPYIYSRWSGPLLVYLKALRERSELPALKATQSHYETQHRVLYGLSYLLLALSVAGLVVFFFRPSISYVADQCPVPLGFKQGSDLIHCHYNFSDYTTEWTTYYSIFGCIFSFYGLIDGMSEMLEVLSDPSSAVATSVAILHDEHKRREKAVLDSPTTAVIPSPTAKSHAQADPKPEGEKLDHLSLEHLTKIYKDEAKEMVDEHDDEIDQGRWYERLVTCRNPFTGCFECGSDFKEPQSPPSWVTSMASNRNLHSPKAQWPKYMTSRKKLIFFERYLMKLVPVAAVVAGITVAFVYLLRLATRVAY